MTKDEVLKLALESGFAFDSLGGTYTTGSLNKNLEAFANLVAAHKREWVGLTEEEAQQTFKRHNCDITKDLAGILAQAIEAKLKEKNP
jgi:hypothetical protein